ncbi:MAG: hypothetical protein CMF80_09245 [Candidatus Marinimicrobia bacterium]|nr:hypothetical protein [Candidatus Neomarinimicrobiota bacterium]|tara:strand:+ start:5157 stop:6482 length:1326 start_codon:yes stop_codon:yes gene_type:complete
MDIRHKINKITGTFLDSKLENEFKIAEWSRDKSKLNYIMIALIFLAIIALFLEFGTKSRWESSGLVYTPVFVIIGNWLIFSHFFDIILYLLVLFSSEQNKFKYGDKVASFTLSNIFIFVNIRALLSPAERFLPETMNLYFYPVYPLFIVVLICAVMKVKYNYLIIIIILTFTPALYPFVVKGGAGYVDTIGFVLFPAFYLLFTVYQDKIKSRISFYYENLLSKGLRKYFGESLTKQLIKDEGKINAETRWVTISFTDMNKYSTIIEKMSPDIAVQFLNEYFTTLHKVIKKYNGVILNYIGDSVMVIYGAPEPQKDHEILALKTALEMREELKALNQKWNDDKFSRYWKNIGIDEVTCRTGLHCGNLTIGNMGSDDLLQYSAIGDVVNIAARLETVNKEFSTEISMSEEIYASLTEEFTQKAKLQGEINLKGRTKKTNVYSI